MGDGIHPGRTENQYEIELRLRREMMAMTTRAFKLPAGTVSVTLSECGCRALQHTDGRIATTECSRHSGRPTPSPWMTPPPIASCDERRWHRVVSFDASLGG